MSVSIEDFLDARGVHISPHASLNELCDKLGFVNDSIGFIRFKDSSLRKDREGRVIGIEDLQDESELLLDVVMDDPTKTILFNFSDTTEELEIVNL